MRKRKRTVGRWIALVVGLGIVSGGVWYWRYSSQFEATDDAYVTGHQHPVSFRVAGTISEVLVDDNQLVKQGQAVAKLDPKEYEVALAQARADLEKARAQLTQSQAQRIQADAQWKQAEAQANAAKAQSINSKPTLERFSAVLPGQRSNLEAGSGQRSIPIGRKRRYLQRGIGWD